ncbi:MAG: hypothetical protein V2I43_01965 [Parvularcula sp.]|jgi:hypothetical protein|nr:hypothetical protein [Parvularcula sp.]
MPLPLKEHVRLVLLENDRGAKFYRAISDGWSEFCEKYPERGTWRRKATSRNNLWELVVRRLLTIVADDDGLEAVRHYDTISIIADDEVLFRFKHADIGLATANYPTAQAEAYDDHDTGLFGRTDLQRVNLCYVLDQFETSILWTGVAASNKGRHLWKIELDGVGAVAPVEQLPTDLPEVDITRLAKVKKPETGNAEKKKRDNG